MLNKVFLLALLCVTMQGAPVRKVHVGVLDKVTARVHIQVLDIQEGFSVGRLHGVVQSCHKPNEKAFQKDVARCFVEVYESSVQDATQKKLLFGRWVYKDYPSLSLFAHRRYDLWIVHIE